MHVKAIFRLNQEIRAETSVNETGSNGKKATEDVEDIPHNKRRRLSFGMFIQAEALVRLKISAARGLVGMVRTHTHVFFLYNLPVQLFTKQVTGSCVHSSTT